jgi:MerR family mercuric resistance operon transcriptional regulator
MQDLSIGQLARRSDVGVETIRFYEREGLIAADGRTASGYRRFAPAVVDRLGFIKRAKKFGFSLTEIRQLLDLAQAEGDRGHVKEIAEHKLAEIEHRIAELQRMRAALADLTRQCSGHGPVEGCPIIETLSEEPGHE